MMRACARVRECDCARASYSRSYPPTRAVGNACLMPAAVAAYMA